MARWARISTLSTSPLCRFDRGDRVHEEEVGAPGGEGRRCILGGGRAAAEHKTSQCREAALCRLGRTAVGTGAACGIGVSHGGMCVCMCVLHVVCVLGAVCGHARCARERHIRFMTRGDDAVASSRLHVSAKVEAVKMRGLNCGRRCRLWGHDTGQPRAVMTGPARQQGPTGLLPASCTRRRRIR